MAKLSYVSRTLRWLEDQGYEHIGKCQHWNHHAKRSIDLFGIFDIMTVSAGEITGVQVCGEDWMRHVRKMSDAPVLEAWLRAGAGCILIGWRKVVYRRGSTKMVYRPRVAIWTIGEDGRPELTEVEG